MDVTYIIKYWFYRPAVDYNESDNTAIIFEVQLSWVWQRQNNEQSAIQSHDTKKDDVLILALLFIHWIKGIRPWNSICRRKRKYVYFWEEKEQTIKLPSIFIEANDTKTIKQHKTFFCLLFNNGD